jgi:hypothetical protein
MLVLALQFSRCDDRRMRSNDGARRSGARELDALKTEEKTAVAGDRGHGRPKPDDRDHS